ncbi:MAG: hypothetical protein R3A49_03565 [Acidimicrobiia bacterium]
MFEDLDDTHPPQAGPETVAAVHSRSAQLRRRSMLARSAAAAAVVVGLVGVTAGVSALASDDSAPTDAAASAQESTDPGAPEVITPPPSTAPPTTAPPVTAPTEVAGEQVEAPAPTEAPTPSAPQAESPTPPPPAPGGYSGTVVVPDGWTVRVTVSGPGGSWTHPGLTNGAGFAQGNVASGSYHLSWTAVSAPAPPGEGGTDIGTATRAGQQNFTVTSGRTATVTVYV